METRLHKYLIESKQKNSKSICAVVKVMEWQRGRNNPAKTYIAIAKYCGGKVRIKGYYPCSETGAMEHRSCWMIFRTKGATDGQERISTCQ